MARKISLRKIPLLGIPRRNLLVFLIERPVLFLVQPQAMGAQGPQEILTDDTPKKPTP